MNLLQRTKRAQAGINLGPLRWKWVKERLWTEYDPNSWRGSGTRLLFILLALIPFHLFILMSLDEAIQNKRFILGMNEIRRWEHERKSRHGMGG